MIENNNFENNGNVTSASELPEREPKAEFDIKSFNSYSQPYTHQAEPPHQDTVPLSSSEAPIKHLSPDGSYYTPEVPTWYYGYNENSAKPPVDPALEARLFKKDLRRRFSYVAFMILAMFFIYQFAGSLALGIYAAMTNTTIEDLSQTATMIIGTLSIALVGFPVLLLMLLPKKASKPIKSKTNPIKLLPYLTISALCVISGVLLGSIIKSVLGEILGAEMQDIVSSGLEGVPLWLILIFVCVFPGIFEELIFRKLVIDKTREFGDFAAVVFSALTFGIFHGNFEQFFYAFFTGLLFGYVYVKTGRILYTIILHTTVNFCGSVVTTLIQDSTVAQLIYLIAVFVIGFIGLIALVFEIIDNHKKFNDDIGIQKIGGTDVIKGIFLNPGAITFFIVFIYVFVEYTLMSFSL